LQDACRLLVLNQRWIELRSFGRQFGQRSQLDGLGRGEAIY
jgi:hypothetical protein